MQDVHESEATPQLAGKAVVVTGKFKECSRRDLHALLLASGCTLMGSVSRRTSVVIAGEDPSSTIRAAKALNIPVWSEFELMVRLGKKAPPATLDGPLSDWLARFHDVTAHLMQHSGVRVLNLSVNAGASDAELAQVEHELGAPLAPAIRNLYRQANGLSLRWMSKAQIERDALSGAAIKYRTGTREEPAESGETGCICLLPLRRVFSNARTPKRRVFDHYSASRFASLQSAQHPLVSLSDVWSGCAETLNFEQYMERALTHYFVTHGRLLPGPQRGLDMVIASSTQVPAMLSSTHRRSSGTT